MLVQSIDYWYTQISGIPPGFPCFRPSGVFGAPSSKIKVVGAKLCLAVERPDDLNLFQILVFQKPANIGVSLRKFVYCNSGLAKTPTAHKIVPSRVLLVPFAPKQSLTTNPAGR